MTVGLLYMELFIPSASSLKEKRMVIKSIKDRLRNKFNISVAEVDFTDKWQRCAMAVAVVAGNKKFVDEVLQKVFRFIDDEAGVELIKHEFGYR